MILWDEPDLGLSDNAAAGVGLTIRDFMTRVPELTLGAIVVTHSKALVQQLLPQSPHYLHLGEDAPKTLDAWCRSPIVPVLPETVQEAGRTRYKLIKEAMDRLGVKS